MEFDLLSLDDTVLSRIIQASPSRARCQLRSLNCHLRNLVDEQWTEIRLGLEDEVDTSILNRANAFGSVRHLTVRETEGVEPDTLRAIGRFFPELESLKICPRRNLGPTRRMSTLVALAGPNAAPLTHLRKLSLSFLLWSLEPIRNLNVINCDILEELKITEFGPRCDLRNLFGGGAVWPSLRVLKLDPAIEVQSDFDVLFDSSLPRLEVVHLYAEDAWIHQGGVGGGAAMARCADAWPRLTDLHLIGILTTANELEAFMEVSLPRLESIELGFAQVDSCFAVLGANVHRWPSLQSLEFDTGVINEADAVSFHQIASWRLDFLSIHGINLGRKLGVLGTLPEAAPLRASLRTLHLEGEDEEEEPMVLPITLFEGHWPALEDLEFSFSTATDALTAAARAGGLPRLQRLQMPDVHLEDGALEYLCNGP